MLSGSSPSPGYAGDPRRSLRASDSSRTTWPETTFVAACVYLRRLFPQLETFAADMRRNETALLPSPKPCSLHRLGSGSRLASEAFAGSRCRPPQTGTTRRTPEAFAGSPPHRLDGDLRPPRHLTATRAKWIPPCQRFRKSRGRARCGKDLWRIAAGAGSGGGVGAVGVAGGGARRGGAFGIRPEGRATRRGTPGWRVRDQARGSSYAGGCRLGGARGAATDRLAYSSPVTWRATCKRLVASRAAGLRSRR